MLVAMAKKIKMYKPWISGDAIWETLRDACDPGLFEELAAGVGLDPAVTTARDVFLKSLSTVTTYHAAWDIVLRFSTGANRKAFLDIWNMERDVNTLARQIFRDATYLYRGQSVTETAKVNDGTVGPSMYYSFVSLSSSLIVAVGFAFGNSNYPKAAVVLAIDAHKARSAGATPAIYSLASDVLDLRRSGEGTDRTFPMENSAELQVHFPDRWPLGSAAAMVAVITTLPPTPDDRLLLEEIGLPVLDYADLFKHVR